MTGAFRVWCITTRPLHCVYVSRCTRANVNCTELQPCQPCPETNISVALCDNILAHPTGGRPDHYSKTGKKVIMTVGTFFVIVECKMQKGCEFMTSGQNKWSQYKGRRWREHRLHQHTWQTWALSASSTNITEETGAQQRPFHLHLTCGDLIFSSTVLCRQSTKDETLPTVQHVWEVTPHSTDSTASFLKACEAVFFFTVGFFYSLNSSKFC